MVRNKLTALFPPWLILLTAAYAGCSRSEEVASGTESAPEVAAPGNTPARPPDAATAVEPIGDRASPGPAFASLAPASDGHPPHPAIPAPLAEPAPSPDMLASTGFRWLPGHWIWTGNQYEWQPGLWIYDVPGHTLVPARWVWDGEYWVFQDSGWAAAGSTRTSVRPTAVPGGSAGAAFEPDPPTPEVDVYVAPSSYAVYVWTGTWVAPPIVYPEKGGPVDTSRYAPRAKSAASDRESTGESTEPPADRVIVVESPQSTTQPEAAQPEGEVELIPGVLHGGKRGEEELRLMEEAEEREAEEQKGVDSVYVPYQYDPYYRYRRYPPRPRPPARPKPLPAPATSGPSNPGPR